ncbi:hypothetical protein EC973_008965 [Apophysomyces ossiformis]|uniref:HhH-GPD domain-containing protein n=1 Tax=Apophysomyces ossiformis TaxID=679940 RepID=A0A8H7EQN8_9FUNG|nr:hypothetical protein EC973_008965 [Apophysomyces ossiformis]
MSYRTKSLQVKSKTARAIVATETQQKEIVQTSLAGGVAQAMPLTVISRSYNFNDAAAHLRKVDPKLAAVMTEESFREFQERIARADSGNAFRALARSIIYQQIHGKAALSIYTRFIKLFNSPIPVPDLAKAEFVWFPSPEEVLSKTLDELRSVGLSARKASYIQDLAQKFADKVIVPEQLDSMSDEEISKLLCTVKGIGQWTVDMFLMFNLCHPDVLPVTDLGIRKGMAVHFGLSTKKNTLPSPEEMRKLSEIWQPYRTVASWYMWRVQDMEI